MRPPLPSVPTPLARREALRGQLAAALERRDSVAVQTLSSLWVHRQGVAALEPLMHELVALGAAVADPDPAGSAAERLGWWRQQLQGPQIQSPPPPQPAATALATPSAAVGPPAGRLLPFPPASQGRRPAPAPADPGLASLRAWLTPLDTPQAATGRHAA